MHWLAIGANRVAIAGLRRSRTDRQSANSSTTIKRFICGDTMLAEIFMVRLEAKARSVEDRLPLSTSPFVAFNPRGQLKEAGIKGVEASNQEQPVKAVPQQ